MSGSQQVAEFIRKWRQNPGQLRLGQAFINKFISGSWPELFYETDSKKAEAMIYKWLTNNNQQIP